MKLRIEYLQHARSWLTIKYSFRASHPQETGFMTTEVSVMTRLLNKNHSELVALLELHRAMHEQVVALLLPNYLGKLIVDDLTEDLTWLTDFEKCEFIELKIG